MFLLSASPIAASIHSAEYSFSASFSASAIIGVSGPMFCSYSRKIFGTSRGGRLGELAATVKRPFSNASAVARPRGEFNTNRPPASFSTRNRIPRRVAFSNAPSISATDHPPIRSVSEAISPRESTRCAPSICSNRQKTYNTTFNSPKSSISANNLLKNELGTRVKVSEEVKPGNLSGMVLVWVSGRVKGWKSEKGEKRKSGNLEKEKSKCFPFFPFPLVHFFTALLIKIHLPRRRVLELGQVVSKNQVNRTNRAITVLGNLQVGHILQGRVFLIAVNEHDDIGILFQ